MSFLSTSPPNQKPASLHDSARASPEPIDDFHQLVDDLSTILGPSSGIDSSDVDVEQLKNAMSQYSSNECEWQRYAFADYSRAYTRNLVDRGNGKSNLLILVWTPGKASPIHDHANAHCVMKILKGSLTEMVYGWPCESSGQALCESTEHSCSMNRSLEPAALPTKRNTTYTADQVTYMSDSLGLHRISNPSSSEVAISLHLYTPPNAAKHGVHVFNEETGTKSHVKQCHFYSELGVKI